MCLDGWLWVEGSKGHFERVLVLEGPSISCLISATLVGLG